MSDPKSSPETSKPRRRRPWLWLLLFIVLVLLALAGWAGWFGWQLWQSGQQAQQQQFGTLHSEVTQAHSEIQSLRQKLATATASANGDSQAIATLQQNVKNIGTSVDNLDNLVSGGRQRVQLDVVEQLLLIANSEVQLAHDPITAAHALTAADNHLAALNSPRLFELRKAIAQERAALKTVDAPDLTAAALSLSQLIEQVPQLPLRTQPHPLKETLPQADHTKDEGWFTRGLQRIGAALRSLFHVRRTDHPIEPMLTQAQAPLVGQVLTLRLDTARAALVQRNTKVYRSELDSAQQWLQRYYREDDPSVQHQLDQLAKLAALDLNPPLPDISHSVELLRSLRDQPAD